MRLTFVEQAAIKFAPRTKVYVGNYASFSDVSMTQSFYISKGNGFECDDEGKGSTGKLVKQIFTVV